jgi:hypothetical protein
LIPRFEDAIDGFTELAHGPAILGWTIANMFSIAIFNYAGQYYHTVLAVILEVSIR